MDSSLLSPDFKLQLKKQRDRLITKRDGIIQDAIDDATQTIDANIADIDNLLSKATNTPKTKTTTTRGRRKKEPIEAEAVVPPTQSKARKSTLKPPAKTKQKAAADAPTLKAEFKDLKLAQAIPLIFQKDTGRIFSIDNVITALYGTVDPDIHAKTRQRIGVSLGHSAGRDEIIKVQAQPAMYQLNH